MICQGKILEIYLSTNIFIENNYKGTYSDITFAQKGGRGSQIRPNLCKLLGVEVYGKEGEGVLNLKNIQTQFIYVRLDFVITG